MKLDLRDKGGQHRKNVLEEEREQDAKPMEKRTFSWSLSHDALLLRHKVK